MGEGDINVIVVLGRFYFNFFRFIVYLGFGRLGGRERDGLVFGVLI